MKQPGREALFALLRVVRAAEQSTQDLTERTGLTPSQAAALEIIVREGQADAGTVSAAVRLSQAAVTPILIRLEDKQLIVREREPSDRRRACLRPTETGKRLAQEITGTEQGDFVERFGRLDGWAQKALIAALDCLADLLDPSHPSSFDDHSKSHSGKSMPPKRSNPRERNDQ